MKRILIVEDDTALSMGLSRALKSEEIETVWAESIRTAKEQLARGEVALVILDVNVFLLNSDSFMVEIVNCAPLYVAFDVTDEAEQNVEEFLSAYTENSTLDYSSRAKDAEEFESFRRMFVILGTSLSMIVGLIGLLNFVNTVLTGIVSRRKELATLQAIGMTGKQLKSMLICEGQLYTAGSAVTAVVLNLLTIPMSSVIEILFWFCEFRFTMIPMAVTVPIFALIGIVVPVITYAVLVKKSVVERLREGK